MDDLKGRLLEAAVRPFAGDPELQLAASQLLGEQVRPDGCGAEEAIARWEVVDARTRRAWGWNRLLFWVLVSLLLAIWVPTLLGHFEFVRLLKSITSDDKPSIESVVQKRFGARLSASQKLVLFGDFSKPTQVEKMKALWDSQSGNPVYFSEYARVYLKETKQLPPNFLEVARLIDPENAWFTYLAAAVEADGGYEKTFSGKLKNESTPPWKILDVAKLEKAAALLHEARNQPRCQDYLAEITRQRIQAFPVTTQTDNFVASFYFAAQLKADLAAVGGLSRAISAYGWSLGEAGDRAQFQKLLLDTDAFVWTTSHMEVTDLMEAFSFRAIAATHAKHLGEVSRKLGLLDDAIRLEKIHQRTEAEKLARKNRRHLIEGREYGGNGGFFPSLSLHMLASLVASPPLFADRYLLPGRLADHAVFGWVTCLMAATYLAMPLVLLRKGRTNSPRALRVKLANRIGELMRLQDWCWIIGVGVAFPAVCFLISERSRPIEGLNFQNLLRDGSSMPVLRLISILTTFISLPTILARWQLAKRAEIFGFTRCSPPVVTWVIFWNVIQLPLINMTPYGNISYMIPFSAIFMVCAFTTVIVPIEYRRKQTIKSSALRQSLNITSALAAILLLCLIPAFKATQQQAFQQDQISKIDPAFPAASPYECRVAAQMQKETRAILGDEK